MLQIDAAKLKFYNVFLHYLQKKLSRCKQNIRNKPQAEGLRLTFNGKNPKNIYFTSICCSVSCFCSGVSLGSVMCNTPFSTFAPIFCLSTSSGRISV